MNTGFWTKSFSAPPPNPEFVALSHHQQYKIFLRLHWEGWSRHLHLSTRLPMGEVAQPDGSVVLGSKEIELIHNLFFKLDVCLKIPKLSFSYPTKNAINLIRICLNTHRTTHVSTGIDMLSHTFPCIKPQIYTKHTIAYLCLLAPFTRIPNTRFYTTEITKKRCHSEVSNYHMNYCIAIRQWFGRQKLRKQLHHRNHWVTTVTTDGLATWLCRSSSAIKATHTWNTVANDGNIAAGHCERFTATTVNLFFEVLTQHNRKNPEMMDLMRANSAYAWGCVGSWNWKHFPPSH